MLWRIYKSLVLFSLINFFFHSFVNYIDSYDEFIGKKNMNIKPLQINSNCKRAAQPQKKTILQRNRNRFFLNESVEKQVCNLWPPKTKKKNVSHKNSLFIFIYFNIINKYRDGMGSLTFFPLHNMYERRTTYVKVY